MSLKPLLKSVKSVKLLYRRWLKLPKISQRLGLGLVVGIVLIGLVKPLIFASVPVSQFLPAQEVVSESFLERVVAENYITSRGDSLDRSTIETLEFSGNQGPRFYIFNFKTPNLCGLAGCLYSVYTEEGTRVLSLFLHSNLPEAQPLFLPQQHVDSDRPCLDVLQADPTADLRQPLTMLSIRYCYQPNSGRFRAQAQYQKQIRWSEGEPTPDDAPLGPSEEPSSE